MKPKENNQSKPKGFKPSTKGRQGRKDSKIKRVNFDNTRRSKFDRDIEKDIEMGSKSRSANDISTWNLNSEFMKAAGSIPFASILGEKVGSISVPGIMTFRYSPSLGSAEDPVAFNKAFQALYSDLVHANSRNYKYDYPDLAMYVTAGNEVFAALAEPMRIYGLYKSYTEPNRYLADALVRSMGWDSEDFRRHLSNVWYDLNDFIIQTRSIWIPNTLPVLKRWMDMNLHVYTDAEGQRSQTYAFVRSRYWKLSEIGSNQGTSLVPASFMSNADYVSYQPASPVWVEFDRVNSQNSSNSIKWSQYRTMLQDMINSLQASGDRGTIYGDIYNALGPSKIYGMPEFTSDFKVIPEYNAEVLMQIENVQPTGFVQRFIVQNQNAVGSDLRMAPLWQYFSQTDSVYKTTVIGANDSAYELLYTSNCVPSEHILNMHIQGQPTPESIMIATRFKAGATVFTNMYGTTGSNPPKLDSAVNQWSEYFNSKTYVPLREGVAPSSTSTEIIHKIQIWYYNEDNTLTSILFNSYTENGISADPAWDTQLVQSFDWHPFSYEVDDQWGSSEKGRPATHYANTMLAAFGDYDNYTILSDINLQQLHHVALYSAFGVPMKL